MNDVDFQTRPIDQWPGELTKKRRRSQFSCGYRMLNEDLHRELEHLKAKSVVLLLALRESDIRVDGRPRADARVSHPGIIVCCGETMHGPLRMACDSFTEWTANLRAVTLTLKNLRLIDGYGCTRRGEQYRGWAALPAPDAGPTTRDQAMSALRAVIGGRADALPRDEAIREALMLTHPDKGGDGAKFKEIMAAKRILETG